MRTLEKRLDPPRSGERAKGEEPLRMKHGSDRGLATSAKPRLLAAFTAVAMMFATAVPALMPKSASADDGLDNGATCTPGSIEMGAPDVSGNNNVGKDDDVATWVGGNMYLGAPVDATTTQYGLNEASIEMGAPDVSGNNNVGKDDDVATWVGGNMYLGAPVDATTTQYGLNEAAIDATYAVEAEGLTLVNGKLLSNATKNSWDQYGFRFGVVGFGSQFRPAAGSDALVVGGNTSNVTLKDFFGTDVNALAFDAKGRAWIGMGKTETSATSYVAKIAGSPSARLSSSDTKLPPVKAGYTRVFVKGDTYKKLYAWEGEHKYTGEWGGQTLQKACGNWHYTDVLNNGADFNVKPNNGGNGDGLPQYRVIAASAAAQSNSAMIMPGESTDTAYGAPSCGANNVTNVIVPSTDKSGNPTKPQFTYNGKSLEPSRNLGQWYVFEVPVTDQSFSITVYENQTYTINPHQRSVYTIWNKKVETGDPASLGHLENDLYSVYVAGATGEVKWNAGTQEKPNPLQTVKIIANDQTKEVDYSNYNSTIQNLSSNFANVPASEQIDATVGFAIADDNYTRYKYLPTIKEDTKISMKFDGKSEKLITFDGKNAKGDTIVFRLPASYLTNTQDGVITNGIDFEFKNVGKKTVIVNIVNDDRAAADATNTIEFNTGWRFWWGEGDTTQEISNGYSDAIGNSPESKAIKNAYSTASQSIMWNFPSTSKLTINGGQIKQGQVKTWTFQGENRTNYFEGVKDDPSAAMIGSILVPNGSFEDHVSTNGRVYVGGDFMMYNPTAVEGTGATDATASVIDMDQERHNFPWHGALSTQCAAIGWSKVKKNQDGTYEALGGTSWRVYASLEKAVAANQPNAEIGKLTLLPGTVVDNNISTGDANSTSGAFTINNLKENATYYIQEANAPTGYKVNPNIYQIKTGDKGTTSTTISKVYKIVDGKAEDITSSSEADKLLNGDSIINENDDVDISWGKKSSEDTSDTPTALPGSEWTLTDTDGKKYTIIDNTTQAEGVQIWYNGADESGKSLGEFEMGGELQLSAKVTPDGASPAVTWTSSDPDYVQVSRTGRVFLSAYNPETNGEVTITAKAEDPKDGADIKTSVTLTVKPITPTKFELTNNGSAVTSLNMNVGESEQLTATVEPSTLTPVWSTGNASVATVENGLITATGEGTTTIKATVGTKVESVTVTVTDKKKTVIYVKSNLVTDNDKRYQYIITNLDNWALNKDHTLTQSEYEGYYSTTIQTDGNAFQFQLWDGSSGYYKPNGVGQLQINGGLTGLNWYSPAGTTALTINLWNDAYTGPPHVGYSLVRPSEAQAEAAPANADATPQSGEAVMDEPAVAVPLADSPASGGNTDSQPPYTIDGDGRTGMFRLPGLAPGTYYLQESKAPDGFLVNPTIYKIVIGQDGNITWDTQSTTAVYVHWPNAKQTPRILYWTGDTEPGAAVAAEAPSMTAQACVEGSNGWYKYDVPIDGKAFNVKITAGNDAYEVDGAAVIAIAGTKDAYTINNDNDDTKVTEGKPAKECPTATTTIYVQSTDPTTTPRILYWDPATTTEQPSWGDDNANGLWMSPEACAGNGMYKYDVPITGKSFNVQVKIGDTLYKVGDSDVITVAGKKNAYTIADGKLSDQVPPNSCPALVPPSVGGVLWISDTPTQVEWDKVDAGYEGSEFDTKNPIAGSIWELEKFTPNGDNGTYTSVSGYDNITDCVPTSDSSCSKTVDKDNAAGKFKLLGLNNGLYRLHEKEAPTGYTGSDAYYYFEMVTSNPTKFVKGTVDSFDKTTGLTPNGEGSANVVDKEVPNYRDLGTVDWTKVSSEALNGTPLAGAEWKIKFKAEGANAYGTEYTIVDCTSSPCPVPEPSEANGNRPTWTYDREWKIKFKAEGANAYGTEYTIVDCTSSPCPVPEPSEANGNRPTWTYDRDPAVGVFKLENLQWGEYSFYESKAPDGYYPSDKTYTFTVDKDNLTGIVISNSLAETSKASGNKIPNTPGFELPSTGGEGNTLIVLFGVALTAISMLGCAIAMRKRI